MMDIRVFPEWEGQDLGGVLQACTDLVEDTILRPCAAGAKPVGGWSDTSRSISQRRSPTPSGLLPFKVRGAPVDPGQAASRFGSVPMLDRKDVTSACVEPRAWSSISSSRIRSATRPETWRRYGDATFRIPARFSTSRRMPTPPTPRSICAASTSGFERTIEAIAGRTTAEEDLRRSIAVFNRNRALLRRAVCDQARERPWRVAAHEAYALVAIGGLVPREEHNATPATGDYRCWGNDQRVARIAFGSCSRAASASSPHSI